MKAKILTLLSLVLLVSCTEEDVNRVLEGEEGCLNGQGTVVTEERRLREFNSITNTIVADMFLTQGDQEDIRIEAQENILDLLLTEVENNRLTISMDECVENIARIQIFITIHVGQCQGGPT